MLNNNANTIICLVAVTQLSYLQHTLYLGKGALYYLKCIFCCDNEQACKHIIQNGHIDLTWEGIYKHNVTWSGNMKTVTLIFPVFWWNIVNGKCCLFVWLFVCMYVWFCFCLNTRRSIMDFYTAWAG